MVMGRMENEIELVLCTLDEEIDSLLKPTFI